MCASARLLGSASACHMTMVPTTLPPGEMLFTSIVASQEFLKAFTARTPIQPSGARWAFVASGVFTPSNLFIFLDAAPFSSEGHMGGPGLCVAALEVMLAQVGDSLGGAVQKEASTGGSKLDFPQSSTAQINLRPLPRGQVQHLDLRIMPWRRKPEGGATSVTASLSLRKLA